MKKALIAGAASVALAAMPVVGVFAVGNGETLVDTLDLTIRDNCTFTRQTTPHTGSTWTGDTFAADVTNGSTNDSIATSAFNVVCNNVGGYQVTVGTTGFTIQEGVDGKTYDTWAYNAGGYADSGSSWYLASNHANQTLTAQTGNNVVAKQTAATNTSGDNFTVTYNAKVSATQQAGTYEATATYTFAEL